MRSQCFAVKYRISKSSKFVQVRPAVHVEYDLQERSDGKKMRIPAKRDQDLLLYAVKS